ncbi:MAG: Grx4 family monothiol glutaredoxin [Deltaproteobacteria bacterium]|nr:MAG: Grx4 family monothiol glutaredoxin [Deltaproteobacteria bacterium]
MTRDIKQEISEQLRQHPVVLYMKGTRWMPQCGFSATVVACLNELGATYKEFDVLGDAEIRDGIKQHSDWPTIPQLYIGGEFVGGCDIVRQMHASGELRDAIKKVSTAQAV